MSFARLFRIWHQRIRSAFRKDAVDGEVAAELAFHYEQLVREYSGDGMPLEDARRAARRALGNMALLEEQCRDHRGVTWFHDLRQDLAYGLRVLRRAPGFAVIAVASLALGIGANGAILGAIDHVLFGALPFPNADRLVLIRTVPPEQPARTNNAALLDYVTWKERSRSFEAIGASLADNRDFELGGNDPAQRLNGVLATPSLFSALGVSPLLGRVLSEDDAPIDAPGRVIVLSHALWVQRFASDPNILGRQLRLNGINISVVGVMPPGFRYPDGRAEYWAPLAINRIQLQGSSRFYIVAARRKAAVTIQQAEAELQGIAAQLGRELPLRHKDWGVRLQSIRSALYGWTLAPLLALQSAVALILLIACANVAGLLLARGTARGPEIALRMALGAGRGRIVRQLLAEGVPLSMMGGLLGIVVAWWGVRGLVVVRPPLGAPAIDDLDMGPRMLVLIGMLAVVTPLLFGIAPALATVKPGRTAPFDEMTGIRGVPRRQRYLRGALVAAQISMALMLLVGAGLLLNSFVRLAGRELNFDPRGLLTFEYRIRPAEFMRPLGSYRGFPYFEISPPPSQAMQRMYERLQTVPGVESVAAITQRPLNSILVPTMPVITDTGPGAGDSDSGPRTAAYFLVTPNFFATMKAPWSAGRDFDARDVVSAPWVAVVNETMARTFWPGENAIGKRFRLDTVPEEQPREVVGVVRDIPLSQAQSEPRPVIYASYLQQPSRYRGPWANMFGEMTFVLRSAGGAMELVPATRAAIREVDPKRPVTAMTPIAFDLELGLRRRRPFAMVFGSFAAVATLLAAIGVYGVMAYSVAQHTREIGIRRALGATWRHVVGMVGRQAIVVVGAGVTAGLVGALLLTRLIETQLWGVTPTDPATFSAVSLLLALVALLACVAPLRRAVRVDPTIALRCE